MTSPRGGFANVGKQIEQDGKVDSEEAESEPGNAMRYLKDLEREKRRSNDGGEVLGPEFFKVQADALNEAERSVDEDKCSDAAEHGIVDRCGFI